MIILLPKYETRDYNPELGIKRTEFDNGFVLYTMHMPRKRSAFVRVRAKVGSAYEDSTVHGISELVEHVTIDGRVDKVLDRIGGDVNGYTHRHATDVYTSCKPRFVPLVVRLFHRAINDFEGSLKTFETERGSITDESEMYEDKADDWLEENLLLPTIFKDTPLERSELGTEDTFNAIDIDRILEYQRKFWIPNNMSMAVAGYLPDEENAIRTVAEIFGTMEPKYLKEPTIIVPLGMQGIPHAEVERDFHRVNFGVGWRVPPYSSDKAVALKLLDSVLAGPRTGRLITATRTQHGLTYDPMSNYRDFGYGGAFYAHMGSDPRKFYEALERTLAVLKSVKEGITLQELRNAKTFLQAQLETKLDDTEDVTELILDEHFYPAVPYRPQEFDEKIRLARRQDVVGVAEEFLDTDNYVLAIVGPLAKLKQAA